MNSGLRVAIIIIPIAVLLTGIGLWRNHYLKNLKVEPKKVYKSTPLQPGTLPPNANTPEVTPVESEDNTDVGIGGNETPQRIDDIVSPEETDSTDDSLGDTKLEEKSEQLILSPEAAAALKEYEEAHSEYLAAKDVLKAAFKISPLDWERIRSERANYTKAKEHRIDALSNLAVYSDEAFDKLVSIIDRKYEVEKMIAEMTARDNQEALQGISDIFKTMSLEEREHILEVLPDLKEIIESLQGEVE